jgi:dolichyl-phosphate-mannose-protein mannosyltransferase
VDTRRLTARIWWRLAGLCLALALPLRLAFFAGFGLGDDPNESISLIHFAQRLRLDPTDFLHYRLVNIVVRGLCYRWFGVSEAAMILPVLGAALATHGMGVLLAGELLGARAAFLASLLFLVTPYETLASTANVPDYFHAFFGTAAAWAVVRGLRRGHAGWMALAAACVALGLMNRVSTLLLLPVLGLAMLASLRRWRGWLVFWTALAALVGLGCAADWRWSGSPVGWLVHNSGGGIDVTSIVGTILKIYPRYVFLRDDHAHWMFGLTGWAAAGGALVALVRTLRGRAGMAEMAVLLAFVVFGGLFEFLPHRLTLAAYWSHPRIFRYLAQLAPALYLCGAYLLERAWRWRPALGLAGAALVALMGLWQTPAVSEPLRDANRDARALIAFLRAHEVLPGNPPMRIQTDYWRVGHIRGLYASLAAWDAVGVAPESPDHQRAFLASRTEGLVVTGGAGLPWYGSPELVLSLSRLGFQPPPSWRLVWQYAGAQKPWRSEPLRVWLVH